MHKNTIMEQRLFKPKQFVAYLRDIQESLDVIIRTRPEARKLGNGNQGKQDGGDNAPKQVNNRYPGGGAGYAGRNSKQLVTAFQPIKCGICSQQHPTYKCENLKNAGVF